MWTSNYARAKQIPAGLTPISISIKPPYWWKGRHEPRLCPTNEMLSMIRHDYDARFEEILSNLDARQLFQELGPDVVLLCYETPNTWCHRRRVAEWFEASLGIQVPELGFDRAECLPYHSLPEKATPKSKARQPKRSSQLWMF